MLAFLTLSFYLFFLGYKAAKDSHLKDEQRKIDLCKSYYRLDNGQYEKGWQDECGLNNI